MTSRDSATHQNTDRQAAEPRRRAPVVQEPGPQTQSPELLQRAVINPFAARPVDILALQRRYGNQAVQRLLARAAVQAKLTVGPAGDRYEQEAGRVAEQVKTMAALPSSGPRMAVQRAAKDAEEVQAKPLAGAITLLVQRAKEEDVEEVQAKPLAGTITPLVQRAAAEDEEEVQAKPLAGTITPLVQRAAEEEEEVQAKPLADTITPLVQRAAEDEEALQAKHHDARGSFEAGAAIEDQLHRQSGGGSPLPAKVRSYMEPRFGADFSGVRVHTGSEASQLNRQLSAQAFTHGNDIYLGEGRYSPGSTEGQRLLAHELTHVVQQTGGVQRNLLDVSSKDYFNARMKNRNTRRLHNNIPSSGMGKFDAEYLPDRNQLLITVRLYFNFVGGWQDAEKLDFKTKFTQQVQAGWSGKYTFQCVKPGWDEFTAVPEIRVVETAEKDEGHYNINANHGPGRAMVGREGSQAGQTSGAEFFQPDVNPAPHKSGNIRCSIATHEADRIKRVLAESTGRTVYFDKYSSVLTDAAGLDQAAAEVLADKLPGAPKVSLKVTGFASKREMKVGKGIFARRDDVRKDADQRRAQSVAAYLKGKLPGYQVVEETHQQVAEAAVAKATQKSKSQRAGNRAEGLKELAAAKKDLALKSGAEYRKAEIGVDDAFAQNFAGDPYAVAVHEFGHMLGNPDEYFTDGPKTLDLRIQQMLNSGDPKKVNEGINLQGKKEAGKVDTSTSGDRADIQANYALLVQSAGLEIPAFGPQSSSLMSAGTDLLKRHYVPLWEALGRITEPTIAQNDWKIV